MKVPIQSLPNPLLYFSLDFALNLSFVRSCRAGLKAIWQNWVLCLGRAPHWVSQRSCSQHLAL